VGAVAHARALVLAFVLLKPTFGRAEHAATSRADYSINQMSERSTKPSVPE
jgi:hypothetical protein